MARWTYPAMSVRFASKSGFTAEERGDIGGGGFVALLHEIGRKTCRKRDKQGGNRLGLFTRKKKDNAPENRPVPRHIAVIMDGNGRWAKKRGLPRKAGHKVGAETFRTIATYCKDIGVQYFTVYAFSTENWKRPQDEVDALMNLFRSYLKEAAETMFERGVAVRVLGDLTVLPEDIRAQIAEVDEIADRLGPDAATASLCINYGGRDEIKNAVRAIAEQVKNGELAPEDITEDTITANLYTAHMPDPGPHHPSFGRDPHVQLPAVAVCLLGVLLHRCAVAGLQNHRSGCGNRQF